MPSKGMQSAKAAAAGQPRTPAIARVKVKAVEMGYYDHKRRREGDVFWIRADRHETDVLNPDKSVRKPAGALIDFSDNWMVIVDDATTERETTPSQALQRQHDEILGGKALGGPTGDADVLRG